MLDLSGVQSSQGFEILPAGEYVVAATKAEYKQTRDRTGGYIEVELTVKEPSEYSNRKIFDRFHIQNQSLQLLC